MSFAAPDSLLDERLVAFVERMPKVELHLHLEGSIRPATLLDLAKKYGVALPAEDPAGLATWLQFRDFPHFIEAWLIIVKCIPNAADLTRITRELGEDAAAQRIRYLQVSFVPSTHQRYNGLPYDEVWAGIRAGADWVERTLDLRLEFVPDFPRNLRPGGERWVERTAELAIAHQNDGVAALGLGGYEVGNPPELFEDIFREAKARGLASWPHAGETVGPESIWGAIRALGADRLAHGIRAVEDPELVRYLAAEQIACDVCPTSNVCLKVYPSLREHPIRRLLDAGVPVTVSTDDPTMFGTTMTKELLELARAHNFTPADLARLTRTAIDVCFLREPAKARLRERVEHELTEAAAAADVSLE
jgi:adenosine deaminase